MCSIINCTYNESPISLLSSLCTSKTSTVQQQQPSESACDNSSDAAEIYFDDTLPSTQPLSSEYCTSSIDLLSLHPEDQTSLIFTICYAMEMLSTIHNSMLLDCLGCLFTALSQTHHSGIISTREKTSNKFFSTTMDTINEENVRRRLRTFAWKSEFYTGYEIPSKEEFTDLISLCRGNWCDYIYEIMMNKFSNFCEHAIRHAQK